MSAARSFLHGLPLLLLLGVSSQSIKNCGGPSDHFTNVEFAVSPDPIQKGKPFSIIINGDLDEDTTDLVANISLAVKALGVVNVHVGGQAPLSYSPGVPKGSQKLTLGPMSLPTSIPGSAVLKGRINILNGKGEAMGCADLDMNIPAMEYVSSPSETLEVAAPPTITSCGTTSDHIPDFKIDSATKTVTGTLDELVTKSEIAIDIKLKVLIVSIPIKMTIPISYTPGFPKGPMKLSGGASTVVVTPKVKSTVTGTVKSNDANGEEIFCLNLAKSDVVTHKAMPDCSTTACNTMCSCVEKTCGDDYANCAADSQCNGILQCMLGCKCSDLNCELGCIANKTLDTVSKTVSKCAMPCITGDIRTDPEWTAFKAKYKKHYDSDADEAARYKLFQESKTRVARLNALNGEPAFGINWMSDRKPNEKYKKGHKKPAGFVPSAPVKEIAEPRSPASIDWRLTDAVTAIKNQGQCGSCWAFSATEAVESQLTLSTGGKYRLDLSPQQITSCAPATGTYGCQGCNGGFTEGAYEYLKTVPGLANSFYIPYNQSLTQESQTMVCPTKKVEQIDGSYEQLQGGFAAVTGYSYATPPCTQGACANQDLKKFAAALAETPVSICVNAGAWNDYTGGVMTSAACGSMGAAYQDHCVMAVGFNSTAPKPYWIVRNSWASTWGEQGYVYLEMDKNTCGLADDATIPEVKVDLSDDEAAKVAELREVMYRQATRTEGGASRASELFTV